MFFHDYFQEIDFFFNFLFFVFRSLESFRVVRVCLYDVCFVGVVYKYDDGMMSVLELGFHRAWLLMSYSAGNNKVTISG